LPLNKYGFEDEKRNLLGGRGSTLFILRVLFFYKIVIKIIYICKKMRKLVKSD
jgi:hypothetical protein